MKFYLTIILTIVFIGVCKAQDKVHIDTASNCSPDAAAANTMGSRLDDKGETERAADYYRLAIQYDPKCGPAYNNLGGYYFKSKKYAEAILLYRKALQMDERWAWLYYYNTAKSYVALGQYEDAVKNYGEVTRLRPKETSVYYTRANLCLRMAQGVTAASDAQSFLKLKGWRNKDSQYAVLIGYLGYRQAHLDDDAHNLLIESAKANKSE